MNMVRVVRRAGGFALLASATTAATAAVVPVPAASRVDSATLVVEGRVMDATSFREPGRGLIHTRNMVRVLKLFKGELDRDEIAVVTPGGRLGGEWHLVRPALALEPGDRGIFFLRPSRVATGDTRPATEPRAGVQGFVRFDERTGRVTDGLREYADGGREVLRAIALRTGRPATLSTPFRPVPRDALGGPAIAGFAPTTVTAGTGTVLTIDGGGFGSSAGQVGFRNADDGGSSFTLTPSSEILSWADDEIVLLVPTRAGTGTFLVLDATSQQALSPQALTVVYNQTNLTTGAGAVEPQLADRDGTGGYTLDLSTATANGGVDFSTSAGLGPFERALETWRCSTGFNVATGGTTGIDEADPGDGNDVVMFDNDASPLPSGTLGRTYTGYTSCDGTSWAVAGFDVVFRRDGTDGIDWNYGPGETPFFDHDFESVAVHELGHAHQLGHVIAPGKVMHYQLTNGADLRLLDPVSDVAGGDYVLDHSLSLSICSGTITGMVPDDCPPGGAEPGDTLDSLRVTSSVGAAPPTIELQWNASCSTAATDYAIYEGALGDWTGATARTCTDAAGDLAESVATTTGDRFYLVVPLNAGGEGSYGRQSDGTERTTAAAPCATQQILGGCR